MVILRSRHSSSFSKMASLVWIEAWSVTITVGLSTLGKKASMQAITTSELILWEEI